MRSNRAERPPEALSDGGSFTLMCGYVFDDPIPEAASFAVANGGVEGFVRAAALSLERRVRINAVSPGLAQDSYGQFGDFNPGRAPVPMRQIASGFRRSVEGWRSGEIIRGMVKAASTSCAARRSRSSGKTRGPGNRTDVRAARA